MPQVPVRLSAPDAPIDADAVVVGVLSGARGPRLAPGSGPVDAAMSGRLLTALRGLRASGEPGNTWTVATAGLADFDVVTAVGLGRAPDPETTRRAVGAALRGLSGYRRVHLAIDGPVGALVEGALLGSYRFLNYKSDYKSGHEVGASADKSRAAARLSVAVRADAASRRELATARCTAAAVNLARDLVNTPPNDLYPESFADRVAQLGAAAGLEVEVLDPRALKRGGFGGILGAGAGSHHQPRLVRLIYRPGRPRSRVALVGKGITFDSGGLNLKSANLTWMKAEMAGAAATIAATLAAAELRLPVEVIATLPMAENMPGGGAFRPSDVLTLHDGTTVKVVDTSAEGRLVLGDAISRALADSPDRLIEISTLSAGQLIALGTRLIGVMGEAGMREQVIAAAAEAGEGAWPMPLPDELRAGLTSSVADLVNTAEDRWGGMLVAGRFLAEFMSADVPWVHLDITGPAFNAGPARDYTPRGGTGAAVRTIIAALRRLAVD
jgi:leucyl aminopeptidase